MQQSLEQLQNNRSKKAGKSQKNAAQKMEELSDQLNQMQSEMSEGQTAEDMDALRQILENLIQISFDQETLIAMEHPRHTTGEETVRLAIVGTGVEQPVLGTADGGEHRARRERGV